MIAVLPIEVSTKIVYTVSYRDQERTFQRRHQAVNWLAKKILRAAFSHYIYANDEFMAELKLVLLEHGVETAEKWVRWAIYHSNKWTRCIEFPDHGEGEYLFDPDEYANNPLETHHEQ